MAVHYLSSYNLINQGGSSGYYPNTTTPAFTDPNFYTVECNKTGATETIQENGCAICLRVWCRSAFCRNEKAQTGFGSPPAPY